MRPFPAALRSLSSFSATRLSMLILPLAILSTFTFAAAPDRITAIAPGQFVKLQAGVPMKAQPKFDQGRVDPTMKFSPVTLLTVPSSAQQKALRKLVADQQNPKSGSYHKWLKPAEYADQFGLSPDDVAKITSWLKSQGFTVVSVAHARNWVKFSGTAEQIESALHTELHHYKVDGQMHIANSTIPSVPAALAGIVTGFRGLTDFGMKPMDNETRQTRLHHDYFDSNFSTNFISPGDVSVIYDVAPLYTAGIDGTGQTLAVIGQTDIFLSDINDFRSGFGLSQISGCTTNASGVVTACNSTNFQYVVPAGDTDTGVPSTCGDLGEADLDIEWSGATASNAQVIFDNSPAVYDANCNQSPGSGVTEAWYDAVDNSLAPVISLSYGICELGEASNGAFTADEAELVQANSQGITFLSSSGDTGSAACDGFTNAITDPPNLAVYGLQVNYPASSAEVTGVGGTALPYNDLVGAPFWNSSNGTNGGSALSYVPEQAWNDTFEFAAFCTANPTSSFCESTGINSAATAQAALGIGAGGGGQSACTSINNNTGLCLGGFARPSWQTVTIPGTTNRLIPDISLMASPNFPGYIFCTQQSELGLSGRGGTCDPGGAAGITSALALTNSSGDPVPSVIGGTSVSTPVFAGIVVLLNQYLAGSPSPGLGNINPTLYSLAATSPSAFHSVETGNNIVYCVIGDPSFEPVALQCPNSGFIGLLASNFDATNGYNPVTGLGSVDANALAVAWAGSRTAATITITANKNNVLPNVSVTFTATMSPTTAQGPVSFFLNGSTTALGTAQLVNGVATFSTTSLAVGTNNISASFGGDGYNMPATTATSAIVVVVAPTFNFTNPNNTTTTELAGIPGSYSFVATPTGSSTFAATVTFSCAGLTDPTLACVFSPSTIAAGTSGATPVGLTITTAGPNTGCANCARDKEKNKKRSSIPLALPLVGIMLVFLAGRKISKYSVIAGLCLSLALLGLLVACGGGSNPIAVSVGPGSPSAIYPNNTGWPGQTAQFTATVTNDSSNKGVTWTVNGGSANGTIDATGLYTSPTIVAGLPSTVTVTATSVADATKSGTGTETLTPATVPGTYAVVVTANEDGTTHTLPISITVQ